MSLTLIVYKGIGVNELISIQLIMSKCHSVKWTFHVQNEYISRNIFCIKDVVSERVSIFHIHSYIYMCVCVFVCVFVCVCVYVSEEECINMRTVCIYFHTF